MDQLDLSTFSFDLDGLAQMLGVAVVFGILPEHWLGAYHHATRTVRLLPGLNLSPAKHRSVLAHELGHAFYGHTADRPASAERLADRFAARVLIREADYYDARASAGPDTHELARILRVLPWVVREYENIAPVTSAGYCVTRPILKVSVMSLAS